MNCNYFTSMNLFVMFKNVRLLKSILCNFIEVVEIKFIHLLNYVALTHQLYVLNIEKKKNQSLCVVLVNVFKQFHIIVQLLKIVTIHNPFCINNYLSSMAICNFGANKLLFLSSFFLHSNHKYLMKRVRKINCIIILHVFFSAKSFSENLTKQIKKE